MQAALCKARKRSDSKGLLKRLAQTVRILSQTNQDSASASGLDAETMTERTHLPWCGTRRTRAEPAFNLPGSTRNTPFKGTELDSGADGEAL